MVKPAGSTSKEKGLQKQNRGEKGGAIQERG